MNFVLSKHLLYKMRFLLMLLMLLQVSCQKGPATGEEAADPNHFLELSIAEIREGFSYGTLTSKALVQFYLERIEEIDKNGPSLNSIIQVNPDALQIAEALDRERKAGKVRGPLHGIPVVLKFLTGN